eukprot:SAG11_NODE_258_length_11542_cov_35.970899_2_plen_61_part_00
MADYIPPTDSTPVLDDDLEAAPPGEDDGHTHNDVAVSMHGYDSHAYSRTKFSTSTEYPDM